MRELSMGMSHDFEVAIEEGATIVRVGTAILAREPEFCHELNSEVETQKWRRAEFSSRVSKFQLFFGDESVTCLNSRSSRKSNLLAPRQAPLGARAIDPAVPASSAWNYMPRPPNARPTKLAFNFCPRLGLPQASVAIVSGQKARRKLMRLTGHSPDEIITQIGNLVTAGKS